MWDACEVVCERDLCASVWILCEIDEREGHHEFYKIS